MNRLNVLQSAASTVIGAGITAAYTASASSKPADHRDFVDRPDGTRLAFTDWGNEGAPHGLFVTHKDRLNADLTSFIG